ncbi:virulence-associated protein E [Leptospira ryugenii]|uniref:Virulence-associated protein E n=1 Tax=Leptospira ryugenii TaxID=1917863 RepID=A0A2P2DXQ3_9LEPT|nr:VapE domain-containing protein [Leptospira ryugenii]GBF49415.1 virulence-associated protein E [Leptospira ryugenii]
MSDQIENQIKKEIEKVIPKMYYDRFFKEFALHKLTDARVIFSLNGTGALSVKKHIENKYFDQLGQAVANSIGKRKVELIVSEKIDTTKVQKKSDKIDYDGEVHKLENYLNENLVARFNVLNQCLEFKPKGSKDYILWSDRDFSDLYLSLRRQKEFKYISKDTLLSILNSSFIPSYHPVKEYFPSIADQWDGKTDWIGQVCSCIKVTNEIKFRTYFEKWLLASLHTLYSDLPFRNEFCLILQGAQGWYKSTFINGLIPKALLPYYTARIPENFKSKDLVMMASGVFIWNLDEIDRITKKTEAADLKAFLSSSFAIERAAYGKNARQWDRMANFLGACNKVEFLIDNTGNRRFIVFSLAEPIKVSKFQRIPIEKFWSQVYQKYTKAKIQNIRMTPEENFAITTNNLQYEYSNNEFEIILRYFRPLPLNQINLKNKKHKWLSATDIYLYIHPKHPFFKMDVRWIGRGLVQLGFERRRTNSSGKQFLVNEQN